MTRPNYADDLLALPAIELARRIRAGECTARRVVATHIDRLQLTDPELNAVTADRYDAALAEADAVDAAMQRGEALPPLAGVPFTVKEMVSLEGMPHTLGTLARRHDVAPRDATVVSRLRAAGAIPVATTNVPEWGFWFETDNLIHGRTSNPWDIERTTGGSSGGEGAVIGAGASPFGIGSDIGGSIRIPAAFCGIFGHKPSHGVVPLTGHYPVYESGPDVDIDRRAPHLVIGPLSRSARDLMPLLRIMAGPDGVDPNARDMPLGDPAAVRWESARVFVLEEPRMRFVRHATADASHAVHRAARAFEEAGARLVPCDASIFHDAVDLWAAALRSVGTPTIGENAGLDSAGSLFAAFVAHARRRPTFTLPILLFVLGERIAAHRTRKLDRFLARLETLSARFAELLGDDGILIMPAHPRSAPRHGRPLWRPFDFAYTAVFNALRVPVTVAPAGVGEDDLPLGVQIAAPHAHDHRCIAAAELLEAALPPSV